MNDYGQYTQNSSENDFQKNGYIETPEEKEFKKKTARKAFAVICVALLVCWLLSEVIAYAALFVLKFTCGDEFTHRYVNDIASIGLYLIATPIAILILSGLKKFRLEKHTLSFPFLLGAFAVSIGGMLVGSIIGQMVNNFFGQFFGNIPGGIVDGAVSNLTIPEIIIFVCIMPGIFEELLFRKVIIDKTIGYSKTGAILFSGLTFGIFHGNFEQFFYAFIIGTVFSYIYAITGRIVYTMCLHIIMNFFGAAIPMMFEGNVLASVLFSLFEYGILIAGIIVISVYAAKGNIKPEEKSSLKPDGTQSMAIPFKECAKQMFGNAGFITFASIFGLLFLSVFFRR